MSCASGLQSDRNFEAAYLLAWVADRDIGAIMHEFLDKGLLGCTYAVKE